MMGGRSDCVGTGGGLETERVGLVTGLGGEAVS